MQQIIHQELTVKDLTISEIDQVSGGVDQATQIGFQGGMVAMGVGMVAAGMVLSPFGAALLIGTSIAVTAAFIRDNLK